MTEATQGPTPTMTDDRKPTEAEIEAFERDDLLEDPAVPADQYPRLWNISAGMVYERVIRALDPSPPEYVTVPLPRWRQTDVELSLAITEWNVMWEAAQYRRRIFSEEQLPLQLREIADRGDVNVVFVPKTACRYYEYAPLFHLLPRSSRAMACRSCAAGNGRFSLSAGSTATSLRTSKHVSNVHGLTRYGGT